MKIELDKPTECWVVLHGGELEGRRNYGPYMCASKPAAKALASWHDSVVVPVLVTVTRIPKRKAAPRG